MMDRDNVVKTERGMGMWKFKVFLIGVLGVLIFGGLTQVSVAKIDPSTKVVSVSGEISSVDIRLGKLQLELEGSRDRRDPAKYRINQDATRVTDSTDKKFLKLEDLQEGQHVIVEFNYIPGELVEQEPIAQKIIVNPSPAVIAKEASLQGSTSTTTTTTTRTTTK